MTDQALGGVFILIALAALGLWIWAIVDVVKVPDDSMFRAGNKLIWVLVVILAGIIGAIVYLAVGRPSPATRAAGAPRSVDRDVPPPPPPGAIPS